MKDATLAAFRDIAKAMQGPEPRDWEWIGRHMSQRMFGITQSRAEEYAARHGGNARQMLHCSAPQGMCQRMSRYISQEEIDSGEVKRDGWGNHWHDICADNMQRILFG